MERIWLKSYLPGMVTDIDPATLPSLKHMVEESFRRFPERTAFIQMGRQLTYRQLDRMSRDFAAWLQNVAGLRKGDRLAIMLPNTLQYPIAMVGALRAGIVVVNTNPLYTAPELEHQLKDAGCTAIVVLENFATRPPGGPSAHPRPARNHHYRCWGTARVPEVGVGRFRRTPRAQAGASLEHTCRHGTRGKYWRRATRSNTGTSRSRTKTSRFCSIQAGPPAWPRARC